MSEIWKGTDHQWMPTVHRLIERTPQCHRYNEYEIRPIYTTLGFVKILNATVSLFKHAIRIDDKTTTAMVFTDAIDIGKYITATISVSTNSEGTFSRNSLIDAHFCNTTKIKHPAAISQNLDGIRKYAAGWSFG